jgi:formylglycine-generating enzyme required for sulfatase activity
MQSELTQLIGPLISVEGGSFEMGTPDSVADRWNDELLHTVSVQDFQMQAMEVSQALYERVMGENRSEDKTWKDFPVTNVSWNDAMSFIKKLNDLADGGYRLPAEAEWEYAARGLAISF